MAYQCKIPAGATITVTGPAPPAKDLWRRYNAYFVTLLPHAARPIRSSCIRAVEEVAHLPLRLEFKPGEAVQVDFGAGPRISDVHTGDVVETWLFVMILGCHAINAPNSCATRPSSLDSTATAAP